jgi:hypothetical protein
MEYGKSKRLVYWGVIIAVVCAVQAFGATYTWVGTEEGDSWFVPSNWNPEGLPSLASADTANINTLPGVTISGGTATTRTLGVGAAADAVGLLNITGGNLSVTGLDIANVLGAIGTVNMYAGNHSITYLCPGFTGHGTFNMYGGDIMVSNSVRIAYNGTTSTGILNLYDGRIDAPSVSISRQGGTAAIMIIDGVLLVRGTEANMLAHLSMFEDLIDADVITAPEGYEVIAEYNGTLYPGRTALYTLFDPLDMYPRNKSTVRQSTNQLTWDLPEPNLPGSVTCDVFFGTDPNVLLNPKIVNRQTVESAAVSLSFDTEYYWKIDVYDSSVSATLPVYASRVFTFNTFNAAPVVDAGETIETWMADGPRTVALAGYAVDDDNAPDLITSIWSVLSEPDPLNPAVINSPTALNSTVTLNELGTYVLQLEATDGEYSVTDTMQIIVYEDACTHASNQPGFAWLAGDVNHDCRVDILDLAQLSMQWLELNYSLE